MAYRRAMLNNSFRLFTIRGIEVGVHYSWLIIFGLVTWSLSQYVFPSVPGVPRISQIEYWVLGAITAMLLFASVLIHELAHSFVALARGLDARSITLFIFGGVSNLGGEAKEASTEFLVAIVGPLTSFVLAGDLLWRWRSHQRAALRSGAQLPVPDQPRRSASSTSIPGFPLDGGRVLRSILWRPRATSAQRHRVGRQRGQVRGLPDVRLRPLPVPRWTNSFIGGLWTAAIAWFLHNAASTSVQQLVFEQRLRRVRAATSCGPTTRRSRPA